MGPRIGTNSCRGTRLSSNTHRVSVRCRVFRRNREDSSVNVEVIVIRSGNPGGNILGMSHPQDVPARELQPPRQEAREKMSKVNVVRILFVLVAAISWSKAGLFTRAVTTDISTTLLSVLVRRLVRARNCDAPDIGKPQYRSTDTPAGKVASANAGRPIQELFPCCREHPIIVWTPQPSTVSSGPNKSLTITKRGAGAAVSACFHFRA